MFGYIRIHQPEMKFREFDCYQGCYCGLCESLKHRYGNLSRFTLSYDMTFLVMLLSGLYEPEETCHCCRCIARPFRKRPHTFSEVSDYAADMSVLLYRDKCMDDWRDEKKFSRRIMAAALRRSYRKAKKRYPTKAEHIQKSLDELHEIEKRGEKNPDYPANCFGTLLADLFLWKEDIWKDSLYDIGFYLGKFIYLMDAYDDYEHDREKNCYNPLHFLEETADNFETACRELLQMMIAPCCEAFERLPILKYAEILRNILYAGVWTQFYAIQKKRHEKEESHGSV